MQKQSKKTAQASSDKPLRAIFASVTPLDAAPIIEASNMRGFTCGHCSSTFASNKITIAGDDGESVLEPFCPDCGSPEVSASEESFEFEELTDATAAAVTCGSCKTQHIFSTATEAAFNNMMNCTACGVTVAFEDDGEQEEEEATLNLDDDTTDDLDEDFDDIGDDDDDAFATTAEEQEDEQGDSLVNAPADTVEATETGDSSQAEEPTDNKALDNAPADTVEADADEELDDLELVDALEDIGEEEATAKFVRIGDSVVAFLNDISVGSLHKKDVLASRQEAFMSPAYLDALSSSYTVAGMSSTLNDFGFKRASIKVEAKRIAAIGEAKVEARAEALLGGYQENQSKNMTAALATAAIGINKGFWSAEASAHPLKQALLAGLTAAGVRGAERIIDTAFASASDDHIKQVMAKAQELLAMDPAVVNGITSAIASMRYSSGFVSVASDDEDGEDEDTEESSATPATVAHAARRGVRPAKSAEATASFGNARSREDDSGNGIHSLAVQLRTTHGSVF